MRAAKSSSPPCLEWFGLSASNALYLRNLSQLPSWVAILGSKVVGAIILEQHFPASFEVHFMAVRPEHHRRGIGRALLDRLETEVLGVADDLRELPPPFVVGLQLVISLDGKRSPVETGRHGTAILASGRPR
jgi:GNAT superfamily N-acetyltransferase